MAIVTKDGFCFFDENTHHTGQLCLIVDNRYELIAKYIQDNNITSISININFRLCKDYGMADENLLKTFPNESFFAKISNSIKELYIGDTNLSDIKGIGHFTNLEVLSIGYCEKPKKDVDIDFSTFPKLNYLYTPWFPKGFDLTCNKELESLVVYGFAPKSQNFTSLQLPQSLKCLELVRANIIDFDGLKMPLGEKIECYYCRNIESMKGIDATRKTLTRLMIENSKKLSNYEAISKCSELQSLVLCGCGDIPTLSTIFPLPKLNHFVILNTTVADGDISQLQNIKKVYITNKPHYNYKLTTKEEWKKV